MPGLSVAATLSRTELSLSDLSIENPGTYRIVGAPEAAAIWDIKTADSPYVHGETPIAAKQRNVVRPLVVRVYGSTFSALEANKAALFAALRQFTFHFVLTVGGVAHEWLCYPANYISASNGEADRFALMSKQQVYNIQIPGHPIAIQGAD